MKKLRVLTLNKFKEKKEIGFNEKRFRFIQYIPAFFTGFDPINYLFNDIKELYDKEYFNRIIKNKKIENYKYTVYEDGFFLVYNCENKEKDIYLGRILYNIYYDDLDSWQESIIDEHLLYELSLFEM